MDAYGEGNVQKTIHIYAKSEAIFYAQKWGLWRMPKKTAVQKLAIEVAKFQYFKWFKSNPNALPFITMT